MSDPTPIPSSGSFLDKKISGIKAQYLIVFGLAVAIGAYYWRKRKGATVPIIPTVVDTSGQAGGMNTGNTSGGGGGGGGSGVTASVQQTNAQWARGALNAAIGNGSVDATEGANAVTAFLNGQQLTASQSAIIAKLTVAYGQPPEGVLPIVPITAPSSHNLLSYISRAGSGDLAAVYADNSILPLTLDQWAALGNPAYTKVPDHQFDAYARPTDFPYTNGHLYTVQAGDTPATVAKKFYGLESAAYLLPASITPGQVITTP